MILMDTVGMRRLQRRFQTQLHANKQDKIHQQKQIQQSQETVLSFHKNISFQFNICLYYKITFNSTRKLLILMFVLSLKIIETSSFYQTLYFIHILYTILPKLYLYFFYPKLFFVYNLYMSLIQISYQTLLTKLRDWSKLSPKEQLQLLQHAHSLMGKSFSLALHILDQSPHRISIIDFQKIYLLILDGQKYILFKRNFKARLNDCSCKNSWFRKSGEYAPFMCLHQILLQLSFSIFNSLVPFQRRVEESQSELLELLTII